MFDLKSYLEKERLGIEEALRNYIQRLCPSERLQPPLLYSVLAGGKRLRPILCLSAIKAVGGQSEPAIPVACAIEMIHTYSLIHDDLPALDNDNLRRGKPTCHRKFDEATAILSGDALLNMAFEILSEAGLQSADRGIRTWMHVIKVVSEGSGCHGMIEGQCLDLALEGIPIEQKELQSLHQLKTGALIRASVHSGALLGNGSPEQIEHLVTYANNIGLAFQVVDDILNITGDPERLGKAVGSDQVRQKNTYPALMGIEASQQYAGELVNAALQALSIFDTKAEPLRAIATYIIERNR